MLLLTTAYFSGDFHVLPCFTASRLLELRKLLHEAAAVEAAAVEAAAVDAAQCSSVGPDGRTTELQSFIVHRANHYTLITQRFLHD